MSSLYVYDDAGEPITSKRGRPARPGLTEEEHEIIHACGGLRTAAKAVSERRGAYAASVTPTERRWREVSWQWVKRQHKAMKCDKSLGATKATPASLGASLRQKESVTGYSGSRILPGLPRRGDERSETDDGFRTAQKGQSAGAFASKVESEQRVVP